MANWFFRRQSRQALFLVPIAMALLALCAPGAFGQGATAALNGTVLDPSGRAVPGARVTLTAVATNSSQASVTNGAGRYVFVALLPAQYVLKVEQPGFSTVVTQPFTLAINQTLTRDITLAVGQATQQITVTTAAVSIETTTNELGTAIQSTQVAGLPLNGRNFTQLLELTPGISPIDTDQSSGTGFGGHAIGTFTFPSVSGQSNRSTMYLLDGFTDYSFIGSYAVAPIIDDIQEFKVQSHNDTSAYGGVIGGIVNVVTRGGTNEYHGSVWEFIRNSVFDASNYFIHTGVTPYKQNQFGATFGGPLIPHKFMKRSPNTFFFAAYEGFRFDQASEIKDFVPTQAQLNGDLSTVSAPIFNPYTTAPDPVHPGEYTRSQFTNNQIPQNLINTGLQAYAKAIYPVVTTLPVNGFNYVDTTPDLQGNNTGEIRVDHRFNDQWAIWGTFNKFYSPETNATGFPGITSANNEWGYLTGGNMTYATRDGRSILAARFGRTWANVSLGQEFSGKLQNAYQLGNFNSQFTTGFIGGRNFNPGMTIPGYATMPEGQYQGNVVANTWEGAADFTHVKGRHTLQMGLDINTNANAEPILYVQESYDAYQTQNLESTATTGDALASYLLGLPEGSTRRNTDVEVHSGWEDGFYIQDQWQATHKLEVNLGFRYDLSLWPIYGYYTHNDIFVGDTDLDTGLYILQAVPPACYTGAAPCIPTADGSLPANVVVTPHGNHSIVNNVYDNWQPRIGISYLLRPSTVIRMSGGRYFDDWAGTNQNASNYQGSWPDTSYLSNTNLNSPYPTASTGANPLGLGAGAVITPAPTPFTQNNFFVDPNYKDAYSIEWNFGVQQQFGTRTVFEADYVGSHTLRLDSNLIRNTALYPGPGPISARSPFAYISPTHYEKSNSNANYNALQTKLRSQIGKSSTLLASYTWSKTISLACDGYFGGATSCSVQNPYNMIGEGDRSVAGYDLPQNLAFSFIYALPVGAGKLVNISNRALDEVIGGWNVNGIYTARSGVPYHANSSPGIANAGDQFERPNKTCSNPYQSGGGRQLLNKSCFSTPAPYTFGSEPRNDLRSPHVTNFDSSVEKRFPWGEGRDVDFRTDFFNTFNVHAFAAPDSTITDANFGLATTTADIERELQFSLKITF